MKYKSRFKESSLSRIWKHITEHESGTISAFRYASNCGQGDIYTKKQNQDRNANLKAQLLTLGYGVTAIDGVYVENYGSDNEIEVKEDSFIVIDLKDKGTLKKDLMKLGQQYEQDSITFSKPSGEYYLISTNTCSMGYPGKGKVGVEIKLGKSFFGKDGEFHSKIRGRPFVFMESNIIKRIDILLNYPPTQIRSIKKIAEEANIVDYNICKL